MDLRRVQGQLDELEEEHQVCLFHSILFDAVAGFEPTSTEHPQRDACHAGDKGRTARAD